MIFDAQENLVLVGNVYFSLPLVDPYQSTCTSGCFPGNQTSDGFLSRIQYQAGKLSLAPAVEAFANTNVGSKSAQLTATLTNSTAKTITLSVSSLTDAIDFTDSDDCNGSIASGASCTITLTFKPTIAGALASTYSIGDGSEPSSALTIALSGTGVAPTVTLTPTNYYFGNVTVGTVSPSQIFTLTNTSKVPLNLKSEILTGAGFTNPLSDIKTCSSPIPAGGSCAFPVDFAPKTAGGAVGTYTFVDDAGTQTVSLFGNGVAPTVTLTPTTFNLRERNDWHCLIKPGLHPDQHQQGPAEPEERDPDRCRLHEPSFRHQDMQLAYSGWRILRLSRRLRTEDCRWCGRHLYLRRRRRNSDR